MSLLGECSDRGSAVKRGGEDSNYCLIVWFTAFKVFT